MIVDISSINNPQSQKNNNIVTTNNNIENMEPRETVPTLNICQQNKMHMISSTTKQDTNNNNNIEENKNEPNNKEISSSPKNKDLIININIDNANSNNKKIHIFEFILKENKKSVEYHLNNLLKSDKNFASTSLPISSSVFKPLTKNSNTYLNNNNLNFLQDDEDSPFNEPEIRDGFFEPEKEAEAAEE